MNELLTDLEVQRYIPKRKVNKRKSLLEIVEHFGSPEQVIWSNKSEAKQALDINKDYNDPCDTMINGAYYCDKDKISLLYRVYNDRLDIWKYFNQKYDTIADEVIKGGFCLIVKA